MYRGPEWNALRSGLEIHVHIFFFFSFLFFSSFLIFFFFFFFSFLSMYKYTYMTQCTENAIHGMQNDYILYHTDTLKIILGREIGRTLDLSIDDGGPMIYRIGCYSSVFSAHL